MYTQAAIKPNTLLRNGAYGIDHRNRWMLDSSDIVVTYVLYPGGAAKYKALAERKGKTVVEVSDV